MPRRALGYDRQIRLWLFGLGGIFLDFLDDDGNLAELQQIAGPQRPLTVAQPQAVQPRPVGAAQILYAPAAVGDTDLCVIAADGVIVEYNLERVEPSDAQQIRRFP